MNRALTWSAVAGVLLAVGIGAVFVSTVGTGGAAGGHHRTTSPRPPRAGDGERSAAATGTVDAAESYALDFGRSRASSDATSERQRQTWTVDEVLVAVGDRVTAGQVLARADTSDLESRSPSSQESLELATLTRESGAGRHWTTRGQQTRAVSSSTQSAVTSARLTSRPRSDAAQGRVRRVRRPSRRAWRSSPRATSCARRAEQRRQRWQLGSGGFPDETIALRRPRPPSATSSPRWRTSTRELASTPSSWLPWTASSRPSTSRRASRRPPVMRSSWTAPPSRSSPTSSSPTSPPRRRTAGRRHHRRPRHRRGRHGHGGGTVDHERQQQRRDVPGHGHARRSRRCRPIGHEQRRGDHHRARQPTW